MKPALCLAILLLTVQSVAASAQVRQAPIDVLASKPANYGMRIEQQPPCIHLTNTRAAEKHASLGFTVDLDLRIYPEICVDVASVGPGTTWTVEVEPDKSSGLPVLHCLPHTVLAGRFRLPIVESLGPRRLQGTVWLYVNGAPGASLVLKSLAFLPDGAAGIAAEVTVDASSPHQVVDGFGGQADYSLLDVGKEKDGVTQDDYDRVMDGLKEMGATIARVGIYGDLVEKRAAENKPQVDALIAHLLALTKRGISPILVIWMPPGHMRTEKPRTDEWRDRLIRLYVDFLVYLKREKGIDLRYFQICNEPHSQTDIFTPDFFAEVSRYMLDAIEREKLRIDLVGPDVFRQPEWLTPYLAKVGERVNVIAWKGDGGKDGWDYDHAGMMARSVEAIRAAVHKPLRVWATEYKTSAFGDADADRRPSGGPADNPDYGFQIARLTVLYLNAGVSAPLLWELCDVRRIDDRDRPKSWGAIGYKDQNWRRRSHFHTLRTIYLAIRPGSRLFGTTTSGGIAACAAQDGTRWSVVLINPFPWEKTALVHLPSRPWRGEAALVTSTGQPTSSSTRVTTRGAMATVVLPARSVASLVADQGPRQ